MLAILDFCSGKINKSSSFIQDNKPLQTDNVTLYPLESTFLENATLLVRHLRPDHGHHHHDHHGHHHHHSHHYCRHQHHHYHLYVLWINSSFLLPMHTTSIVGDNLNLELHLSSTNDDNSLIISSFRVSSTGT